MVRQDSQHSTLYGDSNVYAVKSPQGADAFVGMLAPTLGQHLKTRFGNKNKTYIDIVINLSKEAIVFYSKAFKDLKKTLAHILS